jgi:hypothetical protein
MFEWEGFILLKISGAKFYRKENQIDLQDAKAKIAW